MSRYIDAEKLERDLDKYYEPEHEGVIHWIQVQRTADVAPVVYGQWLFNRELLSIQGVEIVKVKEYVCDKCGRPATEFPGCDVLIECPYCHCGAKMSLEDNA